MQFQKPTKSKVTPIVRRLIEGAIILIAPIAFAGLQNAAAQEQAERTVLGKSETLGSDRTINLAESDTSVVAKINGLPASTNVKLFASDEASKVLTSTEGGVPYDSILRPLGRQVVLQVPDSQLHNTTVTVELPLYVKPWSEDHNFVLIGDGHDNFIAVKPTFDGTKWLVTVTPSDWELLSAVSDVDVPPPSSIHNVEIGDDANASEHTENIFDDTSDIATLSGNEITESSEQGTLTRGMALNSLREDLSSRNTMVIAPCANLAMRSTTGAERGPASRGGSRFLGTSPQMTLKKFTLNPQNRDDPRAWSTTDLASANWNSKRIALVVHGMSNRIDNMNLLAYFLSTRKDSRTNENIYDGVYGADFNWRASISENAKKLSHAINTIPQNANTSIDIYAHSMGGLIARYAIERAPAEAGERCSDHVANLFTFGTPHKGVPHKAFKRFVQTTMGNQTWVRLLDGGLNIIMPGVMDMMDDSPFLQQLNQSGPCQTESKHIHYHTFGGQTWNTYLHGIGEVVYAIYEKADAELTMDGIVPLSSANPAELPNCQMKRRHLPSQAYNLNHGQLRGEYIGRQRDKFCLQNARTDLNIWHCIQDSLAPS